MSLTARQKEIIRKKYPAVSYRKLAKELEIDAGQVKEYMNSLKADRNKNRFLLYRLFLILFPIIFFVLLELILRLGSYGENLSLFVDAPEGYERYRMINQNVSQRFFPGQKNTPTPPFDLFLKEKPATGYRIFVLGGSTTAGYPYGNNLMFPRMLQFYLSRVFPDRTFEVINAAMAAINSYALLDFMDEILVQHPDLILIYAGHNEFYGALGVASAESIGSYRGIVKSYLYLDKFKTFLLVRDVLKGVTGLFTGLADSNDSAEPTATLMERLVADQKIPFHSKLYEQGKNQFLRNLKEILRKAHEAEVPVIISELVSNIRDQKPFVSVGAEEYPPADEVYAAALQSLKDGQTAEARNQFFLAKDLDALRFRAAEDFNQVIHDLSGEYEVPVVPMINNFASASTDGIIGHELMLEHLHPNIQGYFRMARSFSETMKEHKFIVEEWPSEADESWGTIQREWGYTSLDSLYGQLRIHILKGGWPFHPKAAPNRALLNYRPISLADTLAVRIWQENNYSLERAHVDLAGYYERANEFHKAFLEYRALIALTPFNASPYLRAADMLLKTQDLEEALVYLEKSLQLEETVFAIKWIGQIYLLQQRTDEAIPYLEKAYRLTPSDPQLLFNLAGAYALVGRYESSYSLLEKLLKISPGYPDARMLHDQVSRIVKKKSGE